MISVQGRISYKIYKTTQAIKDKIDKSGNTKIKNAYETKVPIKQNLTPN